MKKKILIVEDDLDIVDLLQRQVKALGYDSIVAGNGKQAVDMATSQLPHLILMDIMLPVMDGLDATRQIRQNPTTRSIPIIAVTALSSRRDKEKCLQSGCDDYLSKPFTKFTRLQLGSRIEKLLKQDREGVKSLVDK